MNRKMIVRVLTKKHEDFVASIKDEEVRKLVDKNSIISGGAIASMLLREKVNDYDYYFRDMETTIAVAKYYVKSFKSKHPGVNVMPELFIKDDRVKIMIKSVGVVSEEDPGNYKYFENFPEEQGERYVEEVTNSISATEAVSEADRIPAEELEKMEKEPYRPIFMSSNAITLSNKVQLIIRFYGQPDQIHKNYDFVHCTNYWTSWNNELVLRPAALESLMAKHLYYVGSLYPLCSVIRTRKFIKRGWHINAGQYLKMCFQISELDLTNLEVLEDQLTGVDNAYFLQLIEYFKTRKEKDPEFQITLPYVASIIDKIF